MKYIVSKMVADKRIDYHAMRKPQVFDDLESAKRHIDGDWTAELTKENGYKVEKVSGRVDRDGAEYVTVWYRGGFMEYRIDTI